MSEKGQTLIETVIALGAAVLVISAITVAVVSGLSNSQFSKAENLATNYAQQGIEIVRQLSQSNWASFTSLTNTYYCLSSGSATLTQKGINGCGQNIGTFVREVDIYQNSSACQGSASAKLAVVVSWSDSKCTNVNNVYCHQVELDSCVANLNSNITPP
jgi:hypothetical protein